MRVTSSCGIYCRLRDTAPRNLNLRDIANGLAIVRAVRRCRSVKPLIVIHSERSYPTP